jgi:ribosomal protein RSM22 (predicted rRNA methylase)
MRALAETLMAASPLAATTVVQSVDLLERTEPTQSEADLVLLGYVLAEHDVAAVAHLIGRALMSTRRYLAVVEPGTPSGFARIRAARTALTTAGAAIVAPCPHDHACPLPPEDWCHFTVRLPRSKDHRLLKGADAPFEDEPFSYVVAAVGAGVPPRIDARLLRPPIVTKAAAFLALCTRDGLADRSISRRNKAGYKAAGNLSAGDTVPAELLDLRSPP